MTEIVKPSMRAYDRYLLVCVGPRCTADGQGQALYETLKAKLQARQAQRPELKVKRSRVNCFGICKSGVLLSVQPDGVWYYGIDEEKLDRIIEQHLLGGRPVEEWIFHQGPACRALENTLQDR